ncbi:MAG: thymidylate synthase, partial [Promethearchaeia archaeon]
MNCIKEDNAIKYEFQVFVNKGKQHGTTAANGVADGATARQHEEYQYLNLIRDILETGIHKGDRTGTGTIGKFGTHMRFNLRHSFPLLTT